MDSDLKKEILDMLKEKLEIRTERKVESDYGCSVYTVISIVLDGRVISSDTIDLDQ